MGPLNPEELLAQADLVLKGIAADAAIQAAIQPFGYDAARLTEGQALYDSASELYRLQRERYGQQYAATQTFEQAWKGAKGRYSQDRRITQAVLRDAPSLAEQLRIQGNTPRAFGNWYVRVSAFYRTALGHAQALALLGQYGLTQARLEESLAAVEAAETANVAQEAAKGAAQGATKERDAALRTLQRWLGTLVEILRVALADDAQSLEKLGLGAVA